MKFFIAFNLVSKFASFPVAATDIDGAGFTLTTSDAEKIVIAEGVVRVARVLLLAVVIETVA